jgi:hypothetical protein
MGESSPVGARNLAMTATENFRPRSKRKAVACPFMLAAWECHLVLKRGDKHWDWRRNVCPLKDFDMKKQHRTAKESYRVRTHLIQGNHESKHWDFDHHLVPPVSAAAAYRVGSVQRGAQGFVEFASDEADVKGHVRFTFTTGWTNRPAACSRNTWPMPRAAKRRLHSRREWRPSAQPWVASVRYPGLEAFPQYQLARPRRTNLVICFEAH